MNVVTRLREHANRYLTDDAKDAPSMALFLEGLCSLHILTYYLERVIILNLSYRKAEELEIVKAFDMLKEAANWLRDREIDYWQDWHNPPEDFKNWIREGFLNNEFYFAETANQIVGMFRLQYADDLFWGKRHNKAGYIHSFTTKRKYKGRSVGSSILKMVESKLYNEGINFLRLDCPPNIKGLCDYYERYGFKSIGEVEVLGNIYTLYEKRILTK